MSSAFLVVDLTRRNASLESGGNARGSIYPKFDDFEGALRLILLALYKISKSRLVVMGLTISISGFTLGQNGFQAKVHTSFDV
jgi:hypothetical protein